jgi:hypothetical protein
MAIDRKNERISRLQAYLVADKACETVRIFVACDSDLVMLVRSPATAYANGDGVTGGSS